MTDVLRQRDEVVVGATIVPRTNRDKKIDAMVTVFCPISRLRE